MFAFLAGYSGVIAGCSYWLKAKQCNEAIVVIGLMPLALLFIPFQRWSQAERGQELPIDTAAAI
jgi:hypothetical protein